jgi:hypothetical protein
MELGDMSQIGRFHEAGIALKKGDKDGAKKLLVGIVESVKETGRIDAMNYVFIGAREMLLGIDPSADVPALPTSGFEGFDPALLEQLLRARQEAGAGAGEP